MSDKRIKGPLVAEYKITDPNGTAGKPYPQFEERKWRDIDEVEKYISLRRDYYQSSKLSSEFDVELFHKLSEKYDPIDILAYYMDAFAELKADAMEIVFILQAINIQQIVNGKVGQELRETEITKAIKKWNEKWGNK